MIKKEEKLRGLKTKGKSFANIKSIGIERNVDIDYRYINIDSLKNVNPKNLKNDELDRKLKEATKDLGLNVKRMNQRLRELEKRGLTDNSNVYKYINTLAYDKEEGNTSGQKDNKRDTEISTIGKTSKGQIKYRTDINAWLTEQMSKEDINNMSDRKYKETALKKLKEFGNIVSRSLIGQTSTVIGTTEKQLKAQSTFEKHFPEMSKKYTYDEVSKFFQKFKNIYNSKRFDSSGMIDIFEKQQEANISDEKLQQMFDDYERQIQEQEKRISSMLGEKVVINSEYGSQIDRINELFDKFGQTNK